MASKNNARKQQQAGADKRIKESCARLNASIEEEINEDRTSNPHEDSDEIEPPPLPAAP